MSILTDFSWKAIVLCILAGLIASICLYYIFPKKEKSSSQPNFGKNITLILSLFRFLSVTLIAFLITAPLIKKQHNRKEKPLIIIAQDNSQSLNYCTDSAYYRTTFQEEIQHLKNELTGNYDIEEYFFGTNSRLKENKESSQQLFSDPSTDIEQLISDLNEKYYHRNIGALILTSDGIYNKGQNPIYLSQNSSYPIYTVAMGDTNARRDAAIVHVKYNRVVYKGNQFPIEITLNGNKLKGQESKLIISHKGKQIEARPIRFLSNQETFTELLTLQADEEGLQNYHISIQPIKDEFSTSNNNRTIPIEVIDGHQKIALIAAHPHPDIAALCRAIESNMNYDIEVFLAEDILKQSKNNAFSPEKYNLIILHQLPTGSGNDMRLTESVVRSATPIMFVLGESTDLARFNSLNSGVKIESRIRKQNEVTALHNNQFTYFNIDENTSRSIEKLPPLSSPFGEYHLGGNFQTLFSARLGNINSGQPLIASSSGQSNNNENRKRYTFINGEGFWRWQLNDYATNGNNNATNQLINKLINFTALKVNKDHLTVDVQTIFGSSDPVILEAQVYDDNFEPSHQANVTLSLHTIENPTPINYTFNRNNHGYSLNLGTLAPGQYFYTASSQLNGKTHQTNGSFIVEDQQLELVSLQANHSLLQTLATNSGGELLLPNGLNTIPEKLSKRDDIKTIIFTETSYVNMLNLPLLFLLIVLLLGVEWGIRKYIGRP